jgi:hypothetical protein
MGPMRETGCFMRAVSHSSERCRGGVGWVDRGRGKGAQLRGTVVGGLVLLEMADLLRGARGFGWRCRCCEVVEWLMLELMNVSDGAFYKNGR